LNVSEPNSPPKEDYDQEWPSLTTPSKSPFHKRSKKANTHDEFECDFTNVNTMTSLMSNLHSPKSKSGHNNIPNYLPPYVSQNTIYPPLYNSHTTPWNTSYSVPPPYFQPYGPFYNPIFSPLANNRTSITNPYLHVPTQYTAPAQAKNSIEEKSNNQHLYGYPSLIPERLKQDDIFPTCITKSTFTQKAQTPSKLTTPNKPNTNSVQKLFRPF
jgi:hypothetical protein